MQKRRVCETSQVSAKSGRSAKARAPISLESRVKTEYDKLLRETKDAIPKEKRNRALPIMKNIAFMKVKLDEARAELINEHIFTEYDNGGGQTGTREHPGFVAYNKLFTTFARSIKQLTDMMPTGAAASDELIDYVTDTRYG